MGISMAGCFCCVTIAIAVAMEMAIHCQWKTEKWSSWELPEK